MSDNKDAGPEFVWTPAIYRGRQAARKFSEDTAPDTPSLRPLPARARVALRLRESLDGDDHPRCLSGSHYRPYHATACPLCGARLTEGEQ